MLAGDIHVHHMITPHFTTATSEYHIVSAFPVLQQNVQCYWYFMWLLNSQLRLKVRYWLIGNPVVTVMGDSN